jgi:hypothetical protein
LVIDDRRLEAAVGAVVRYTKIDEKIKRQVDLLPDGMNGV